MTGVWIPKVHLNARWAWQLAYSPTSEGRHTADSPEQAGQQDEPYEGALALTEDPASKSKKEKLSWEIPDINLGLPRPYAHTCIHTAYIITNTYTFINTKRKKDWKCFF